MPKVLVPTLLVHPTADTEIRPSEAKRIVDNAGAADKTLVESWTFRLVGAPDLLFERTLMYNRLVNAPTSMVGHDDLEVYERSQQGLHSRGAEWVNMARLFDPAERDQVNAVTNGTSEWQMRNQMRAWAKYMTVSMRQGVLA